MSGRRSVSTQHDIAPTLSSGRSAPVSFSGATQQTEKAALSSGRTVRMSGHATIGTFDLILSLSKHYLASHTGARKLARSLDVPAALKKAGTRREEPEIAKIFTVEEFPEVEESDRGSTTST